MQMSACPGSSLHGVFIWNLYLSTDSCRTIENTQIKGLPSKPYLNKRTELPSTKST